MLFQLPTAAFIAPALGYKLPWHDVALSSLSSNLLSLALPMVTMQVYDRMITFGHIGTLNALCLGVVVIVLVDAALRLARSYNMGFSGSVFEHTVATNAVRHMLDQKVGAVSSDGIGAFLQRMGAVGKLRDFYSGQALATLIDLPFILVFLALIAYMAGALVLAPLALLALMSGSAWHLGRQLKKQLLLHEEADNARYGFLIRTLNGIHTVKALGLETTFERRYEHWQSTSTTTNYHLAALNANAYDQGILFGNLMMIATVVAGAPLVLHGQITIGILIACVLLSGRMMQPVQRAMGLWTRMQDVALAHGKLKEHFSQESILTSAQDIKNEGRIELRNVSFSYNGQEKLLDDVSLNLNSGAAIAISGAHGAGKQTLLKLIAGLETATTGNVLINGIAPQSLLSEQLVAQVGYLPPVGTIFRGTIGANLSRFGYIPEDRVREMAQLLGIDAEVARLPAGYDTMLEGGSADSIPPGLRQRIAIARIIAAKPRILLFYNADRALDKEGYNAVYKLLGRLKGRVTMVLVSNDRNILRLADRHYALEHGKLIERENGDASALYDALPYQELRL